MTFAQYIPLRPAHAILQVISRQTQKSLTNRQTVWKNKEKKRWLGENPSRNLAQVVQYDIVKGVKEREKQNQPEPPPPPKKNTHIRTTCFRPNFYEEVQKTDQKSKIVFYFWVFIIFAFSWNTQQPIQGIRTHARWSGRALAN